MKILKEKQINQLCKKHPMWKELFLSYLEYDENISINELKNTFSLIINYKSIFKNLLNEAKSFLDLNDNRSILERLNDKVTMDIHQHKKEQFIKSLKTEKYEHLFNEKVENEIHTILDNKISIESLKYQFFNKLAKYKTSNDLLESLVEFKGKNIQWNREYYENLIKENNLNIELLDDQNGYMNVQVNDYEACKTLGSQAWCIAQEEKTFLSYINDYKRQIISFNFNLPIENNESIIGFTIKINGKINSSYLKNDNKTPKEIKEQFKFKSLSKEKIENILKEKKNQDAFHFICQYGLMDFYDEYINKEDVDPSDRYNYAIRLASEKGNLNVVNQLLEDPRVDPSVANNYAIHWASYNGHVNVLNRLLEDPRVDPSADNNYAIRWASENGNINVLNRLLEDPRIDPSVDNNYAIRLSSFYGHFEVVNRLLEDPRVDPSALDNSAILLASEHGHFDVVNCLLEDPRVNPSVNDNWVIMWALKINNFDLVNLLLKDKRVCQTLDKNWIKKNLKEEQLSIYQNTLSMIEYNHENSKRKIHKSTF